MSSNQISPLSEGRFLSQFRVECYSADIRVPNVSTRAQDYEAQGYITNARVFSTAEIDHFRAEFDRLEAEVGKEMAQIGLHSLQFEKEFVWQLATAPAVLEVMQEVMGPDIMLLSTHFFCKYPAQNGSAFVAWHQDATYWGLEPPLAHTAWIAVDDADVENGCMRAIPASHLKGIVTHGTSDREGNLLSINQEIPDELVDSSTAVDLALSAGEMSVHHGHLFHASNPNRSTRRRCGLTVRFIPPHVRQGDLNSIKQKWQPILLRGVDKHHNFPETPAPFPLPGT